MNKVTYRYIVNIQLLELLEKKIKEKPDITIQELTTYFHRLKMTYRCGLAPLDSN